MAGERIGVIGAGQMGIGIAHVAAAGGYEVFLLDVGADILERAMAVLSRNLDRHVARGAVAMEDKAAMLARIHPGTEVEVLAECVAVIEAVTEDEAVKRSVYARVCPVLSPQAILATNTSTISITRLAAATDRPGRFVGLHFMNPVPVLPLAEIIRGIATSEETTRWAKDFVTRLGKRFVAAEDFPAFIVSRVLMMMINEAVYTLYEGVGTVEAIDTALRLGAHHPMGPLELADFIGLDTCLNVMHTLHEGLADTKYRPCPLLVKYVDAGWLGRKTGRGFYDYTAAQPVPTR